ncbi:hypothetical protein M0804_012467 [Polistes exclamans]|nr:hypothetical protein M0804_012467 [Polistes exclamans]
MVVMVMVVVMVVVVTVAAETLLGGMCKVTPFGQVWLLVKNPSEIIIFIIREFAEHSTRCTEVRKNVQVSGK